MSFDMLTGIVPAPLFPFRPDYSIDWPSQERYLGYLQSSGAKVIALNMDASEGASLTREEQLEVIEHAKSVVGDGLKVFSGLLSSHTMDAVDWCQDLKSAGADGLLIFPPLPVFMGGDLAASTVGDYHKAVADASGLPIVGFQFHKDFGVKYPVEALEEFSKIENLIGLKDASFDTTQTINTVHKVRELDRRFGVLTGSDTFIMEAMVFGCDGALIGFAGIATDQLIAMHDHVSNRDYAAASQIWEALGPLARHCWSAPIRDYRPRLKEVLVAQGLFDHATVRRPQPDIDEAEKEIVMRLSREAGLV